MVSLNWIEGLDGIDESEGWVKIEGNRHDVMIEEAADSGP